MEYWWISLIICSTSLAEIILDQRPPRGGNHWNEDGGDYSSFMVSRGGDRGSLG
jgi:hypothetical protein